MPDGARPPKGNTFIRFRFGHQQGKKDESTDSYDCQSDKARLVTENLDDKAGTDIAGGGTQSGR